MNYKTVVLGFILIIAAQAACATAAPAEEYIQAAAAIGVKTEASEGRYTMLETVRIAAERGVRVLVVTDAFVSKWEYGQWPLRNIVKSTKETWSIARYGLRKYLDALEKASRADPGVIVIDGVEVAPMYYWKGLPYLGDFAIADWHRHLLVVGLRSARSYAALPVIGNTAGMVKPYGPVALIFFLVPLAVFAFGIFCIYLGRGAERLVYERRAGLLLWHWIYIGIAITVLGAALLVNGYPFREMKFDAYHGSRGVMPYQGLIDYAGRKGALTFWVHPEAKNVDRIGPVGIVTHPYEELLDETRDYTGFAIFHQGYEVVGRPGGMWDGILREYCAGARERPVWAIGTLDYEKSGSLQEYMADLRTVLLVRSIDAASALEAMRDGRMYVARGSRSADFRLDSFSVGGASGGPSAVMGGLVRLDGTARVEIRGGFIRDDRSPVKVLLIRDGKPFRVFEERSRFDIKFDDDKLEGAGRHYYRVEMRSEGLIVVTNPIFIERRS
jgi:hypothetical protein